jgi:uncharacterized membrane protein YuzA (DUF378 family)
MILYIILGLIFYTAGVWIVLLLFRINEGEEEIFERWKK